jgi:hypothetical protein
MFCSCTRLQLLNKQELQAFLTDLNELQPVSVSIIALPSNAQHCAQVHHVPGFKLCLMCFVGSTHAAVRTYHQHPKDAHHDLNCEWQDEDVDQVIQASDILGHGYIVPINLPKAIAAWLSESILVRINMPRGESEWVHPLTCSQPILVAASFGQHPSAQQRDLEECY